jgi:hypothetical protein
MQADDHFGRQSICCMGTTYWLDYFQRSDAIFNKLASRELPVGLANKLTIESNGKFQADVSRGHANAVPVDEAQQQQSAEALMQSSAQITTSQPQSRLTATNLQMGCQYA